MTEQWKPVVGYEGFHEVSNLGRVRSVQRIVPTSKGFRTVPSKILTLVMGNQYLLVMLNAAAIGKRELAAIHRLVAAAFIGVRPSPIHQVNHIDANKLNNQPSNLEWVTPAENYAHAMRLGLEPKGDTHGSSVLTSADVKAIRQRAQQGESGAALGREYGVNKENIYHIVKGRTWKEVQP